MYTPILEKRPTGCHGNYAFSPIAKEFFFEDKNSSHLGGPNEHSGTSEKLSWGCKVGQISPRGITEMGRAQLKIPHTLECHRNELTTLVKLERVVETMVKCQSDKKENCIG